MPLGATVAQQVEQLIPGPCFACWGLLQQDTASQCVPAAVCSISVWASLFSKQRSIGSTPITELLASSFIFCEFPCCGTIKDYFILSCPQRRAQWLVVLFQHYATFLLHCCLKMLFLSTSIPAHKHVSNLQSLIIGFINTWVLSVGTARHN